MSHLFFLTNFSIDRTFYPSQRFNATDLDKAVTKTTLQWLLQIILSRSEHPC